MQTFIELAADAGVGADVVALLLLSADGCDVEVWPLRPEGALTSREDFNSRQLRIVGAAALHGMTPRFVFKCPLPMFAVESLGNAFAGYVRSLLGESFAEQIAISELDRIFALPDTRIN